MATHIQVKRATTVQWNAANPVLMAGEFGLETTTNQLKLGNGTDTWAVLPYLASSFGLPTGGSTGQVLAKNSNTNFDTIWLDAAAANKIEAYVKNDSGVALTKGQVVYYYGSDGTNLTVRLALANSDATSARTAGVLAQDLPINGMGYVITEGILGGLDTSASTAAGDQIYLSGTTAGAVLYGTANKPHAPVHLVYVGVVTKKSAGNGEIYVKVQNGYELDEIHNVDNFTTSLADLQGLVYESSTALWKNKSIVNSLTASTGITVTATQGNITISNSNTATPTGTITQYAGLTVPSGYLLCDGSAVSRATYATLFSTVTLSKGTFTVTVATPAVFTLTAHGLTAGSLVYLTTTGALPTGLAANTAYYVVSTGANTFNLATTYANATATVPVVIATSGTQSGVHSLTFAPYGIGDGTTTFNVPDLRTRVPVGNNATGTFATLGSTGGAETVTLTAAQMPSHTHSTPALSGSFTSGGVSANHTHAGTVDAETTDHTHSTALVPTGYTSQRVLNSAGTGGASITTSATVASGGRSSVHNHTYTSGNQSADHNHTTTVSFAAGVSGSAGTDGSHTNLQPYIVLNNIIKT